MVIMGMLLLMKITKLNVKVELLQASRVDNVYNILAIDCGTMQNPGMKQKSAVSMQDPVKLSKARDKNPRAQMAVTDPKTPNRAVTDPDEATHVHDPEEVTPGHHTCKLL